MKCIISIPKDKLLVARNKIVMNIFNFFDTLEIPTKDKDKYNDWICQIIMDTFQSEILSIKEDESINPDSILIAKFRAMLGIDVKTEKSHEI